MDRGLFTSYIQQPQSLNADSLSHLENWLSEFPYCQSVQLLYTKNLQLTDHIKYDPQLKKAAAYAGDRKLLYQLIIQPGLEEKIQKSEKQEEKVKEDTGSADEPATEQQDLRILEQEILKEAISVSIGLEAAETPIEPAEPEAPAPREIPIEQEEQGSKKSLVQWMQFLEGDSSGIEASPASDKAPMDLVNQFIEKDPQITPAKTEFFSPTNMARLSLVEDDQFVTETLAKIYARQGNIKKAVDAYERLSLKFPEKSTYFAAQISKLKEQK